MLTKGGNGSDMIYGGFGDGMSGFYGDQRHAGGSHKDLIDMTHWYRDPGFAKFVGAPSVDALVTEGKGNTFIWGDHGYGKKSFVTDTSRAAEIDYYYEDNDGADIIANTDNYFLDWERDHVEDELWGDDDTIIGGHGSSGYGEWIWGGDGDDDILTGYGFTLGATWGGDGNDAIHDRGMLAPKIRGGPGNDTITAVPYGELVTAFTATSPAFYFGEDGDDYIEGSHKNSATQTIQGNRGNDKLVGGDAGGI